MNPAFEVILGAIENSIRARRFTFDELLDLKVAISRQIQPHIDAAYRAEARVATRKEAVNG